ncbi:hypothetical protein Tco_1133340 [Tanacetum coccineum]
MGTIDSVKSILTQSALDALCEKYYISDPVHPVLPGRNDRIRNSPPLSVIAAAKVSHFEILCRVHGFVPTVEMDLFAFITHADPTKVRIGVREVAKGEVPLLQLTKDRVVPLAGVNDQEDVNVQGGGDDDANEGDGDVVEVNQAEQGEHVIDVGGIDVVANDEVQAIVADKPKRIRKKRKAADGAGGSGLPPKRLREDHGTSGIGASTGVKSVVALQSLLERTTLPVEVGVAAATTVPFVTSSVTPDSIFGTGLRTRHPAKRFMISSYSSHDLKANATDDEVTSVIRFSMPSPPILTVVVYTTVTAGVTSAPVHGSGVGQAHPIIFRDFASPSVVEGNVAGHSQPVGTELSAGSFYVSQGMDPGTLRQVYIPKWNVINDSVLDDPNVCQGMVDHLAPLGFFSQLWGMDFEQLLAEFNVGTACYVCFSAEIRMRLEHELRGMQRFEEKCAMQANWLRERDAEIASLKAQLSLKEAEAAKAICLRGQVAVVEATEAARASELNGLKERNAALEEQVAALESAFVSKDVAIASSNAQVAKVTQDLSSLQLSCDKLSVKASSLEFEKDKLTDQVSVLETTCSGLRDEVAGYKLFKEQVEAMQDEQVKALSDRRWILGRSLKLVVIKCLQSPEYLFALGGALGRAIDKGMQDGLAAGVDHGRARRGLDDIAAYDPSTEANFVSAVNALRAVNFTLLAQLESQKDASTVDIMDLFHLEGPAAETPEASQLQPSPEQLMLMFTLKGSEEMPRIAACPLLEPFSGKSLTGEASTSRFPATTTALSTTFVQANTVPPEPSAEVPPSPKIVFEREELDTTPEHASAP